MELRKEPNFSYRLLHAVYLAYRVLVPNQVIRADDLARAMVDVAVRETRETGGQLADGNRNRTGLILAATTLRGLQGQRELLRHRPA